MIRALATIALVLTVCITGTSAFLRHSQAGLGCDPWPACYPSARTEQTETPAESVARATHRIAAGTVGILVLVIAFVGWGQLAGSGERIATVVALVVTLGLAWLGRYTPHTLPVVTQGNVLGGFALAGALAWLAARPRWIAPAFTSSNPAAGAGRLLALLALAALALQTASGTLISARHAVAACGIASCTDVGMLGWAGLDVLREGAGGAESQILHRTLAFATTILVLLAARRAPRPIGAVAAALVIAQLAIGFATGAALAPLATATLHNILGAALVATVAFAHRRAAPAAVGSPLAVAT